MDNYIFHLVDYKFVDRFHIDILLYSRHPIRIYHKLKKKIFLNYFLKHAILLSILPNNKQNYIFFSPKWNKWKDVSRKIVFV